MQVGVRTSQTPVPVIRSTMNVALRPKSRDQFRDPIRGGPSSGIFSRIEKSPEAGISSGAVVSRGRLELRSAHLLTYLGSTPYIGPLIRHWLRGKRGPRLTNGDHSSRLREFRRIALSRKRTWHFGKFETWEAI
jgi:hypothetical protein